MSLIMQLSQILNNAKTEYENLLKKAGNSAGAGSTCRQNMNTGNYSMRRVISTKESSGEDDIFCNSFFRGDNAKLLAEWICSGELREKVDLIYCDPPFFSRTDQVARIKFHMAGNDEVESVKQAAYSDNWSGDIVRYLQSLAVRLFLMRDMLSETGSIFIHLDWHAVHAVKLIMDEIFGSDNFVNEIIWTYKSGGASKRSFARKHDTILFYGKSDKYKFKIQKEKSYNRQLKPYAFSGVEEFKDDIGWYTLVNAKDVWQIDMVGRSSGERLDYATQKPEALLRRIIEAVTDEGDLCADFFCGSGTMASAAAGLKRKFLCVDESRLAISNSLKRPLKAKFDFNYFDVGDEEAEHDLKPEIRVSATDKAVKLISYKTAGEKLPLSGKQLEIAENVMAAEPLAFVDYWCYGRLDAENCFHPKSVSFDSLEMERPHAENTEPCQAGDCGNEDEKTGDSRKEQDAAAVFDVFGCCTIVVF